MENKKYKSTKRSINYKNGSINKKHRNHKKKKIVNYNEIINIPVNEEIIDIEEIESVVNEDVNNIQIVEVLDNEEVKDIKKPKKNYFRKILIVMLIIFSIGLIYSGYNIVRWVLDNRNINKEVSEILDIVDIIEVNDNDNTEIIANSEVKKEDLYWDYININLIDVNFDELKNINNDVIGWIQVSGTNVNYPFVKTSNNDYYLNHSFNKKFNNAGWIFMDYRNNSNFDNKNTIIYGHSRLDNAMFGSLRDIDTNGWLNNSDNFIIKTSTLTSNDLWQVFSIYRIPTTSDYLVTDFNNDEEFNSFIDLIINRSSYNFNTSVNGEDKILTLSTCYKTSSERVVIHAKLIKSEQK